MYPKRSKMGPRDRILEEVWDRLSQAAHSAEDDGLKDLATELDEIAGLLFGVGWIDTPAEMSAPGRKAVIV